jgi:16S rRNA (guanine527-N7)-methyltransferase
MDYLEKPERELARTGRDRLVSFLHLVLAANREMNLVSASSAVPGALAERHLLDSLLGLPYLPPARSGVTVRLLDVGSGAGFPAIPLLIVRADVRGTLVESTGKKCRFLRSVVEALGLTVEVCETRFPALQLSRNAPFDVVTSRAVAGAGRLLCRARPLLSRSARALLWTSGPLVPGITRESGIHRVTFHRTPGSERRGIAVLDCST